MKFDKQADIYDKRTGLGQLTAQKIAQALNQMIQPYLDGLLLEIGAGTGEIGYFLQDMPIEYVGIDLSEGMLDIYRKRFANSKKQPRLIQTDGNKRWPLENDSVSVFFSSRAMHQLEQDHVLNELQRLTHPNASVLILGNVKRNKNSVKTIMRKEMHKVMHELGMTEKSGQSNRKLLFEAIENLGGEKLPSVIASRWQVSHAPIESINSWKSVDGIAGQAVEEKVKAQILDTLTLNIQDKFTDLNQALEAEETYELNAIKLPYN